MASESQIQAAKEELKRRRIEAAKVELAGRQPQEDQIEGRPFDFKKLFKNLPQSTANVAEGVLAPIYRPKEFAGAMTDIAGGVGEKTGIPSPILMIKSLFEAMGEDAEGEGFKEKLSNQLAKAYPEYIENKEQAVNMVDSMADYYKGYGDIETIKRRLEEDPAAVMADFTGLLTGAGAGVNLARKGISTAIPRDLPAGMIEEVGKFKTTGTTPKQRGEIAETILREDLPFNVKGTNKLHAIVKEINQEIEGLIKASDKAGTQIPKVAVLKDVNALKTKLSNKVDSIADRKAVDDIVDAYLMEIEHSGKDIFNMSELQEFKKDAYTKVTDWVEGKANLTKTQDKAYKNISLAAKDAIENVIPETRALNQRQGQLLEAREHLERASNRIANRDAYGMGDALKLGTGMGMDATTGMPGVFTGVGALTAFAGKPGVKSRLAQALYELERAKGPINPNTLAKAMAANLAYQTGAQLDNP